MPPVPNISDSVEIHQNKTLLILGGYTDKSVLAHAPEGGEGEGVYTVVFDPEDGKFQNVTSSNIKTNPAFIMKHPSLDVVYMTTEVISDERSEVLVGEINRKNGVVEIVDRKKVHGRSTCHISWDADRSHLIAVSYWDSKLTSFKVDCMTGGLSEAVMVYSDPGAEYVDTHKPDRWEHLQHRQRWPHLHQVNLDPYTKKLFMIPDLGRDMIQLFDIKNGKIKHLGGEQLRKGSGPRHLEFSKKQRVAYVCGELDNTVTVLKYNEAEVARVLAGGHSADTTDKDTPSLLKQIQTVSTVPEDINKKSTIAEMRLHPSGRFLFVGNRGHNSLAVFKTDPATGTLALVDIQSSFGAFPRHFNFDVTGQFLIVGNHASDTVVAFRILESGRLEMVDQLRDIPSIVWITPVQL